MVFLGPNPLKKAFAFVDLFDPSITYMFFKRYPTSFEYFSIFCLNSPSSNGLSLLKIGTIKSA